jgi:hypothetical protein
VVDLTQNPFVYVPLFGSSDEFYVLMISYPCPNDATAVFNALVYFDE